MCEMCKVVAFSSSKRGLRSFERQMFGRHI